MNGRLLASALAIAVVAGTSASSAGHEPTQGAPFRVSISASAFLMSFDGKLQTPRGGAQGTTSANRPRTWEIGLTGLEIMPLADVELRFFERHAIHFSYAGLSQTGQEVLERSLVSQGQTFPQNARVKSSFDIPFGRIGYRAHWLPLSLGRWSLAPEVGVARIDLRYRLQSDEATGPVDRAYVVYFAYWGLQFHGPLHGRLRGEVDLFASAGLSNVVSLDSDFRLLYRVVDNDLFSASLLLGLRGIWLHYEDDQREEQNDIDVRAGAYSTRPWAGVHFGLRLTY